MKISLFKSLFSPEWPGFWFFLFALFSLLFLTSAIFGFSALLAPVVVLVIAIFAFLDRPLALLGLLLFIRMSLDYLSQTARLTLTENLSLSLSQALGLFLLAISVALFFLYREYFTRFALRPPFFLLIAFGVLSSLTSIAPLTSIQEIARLISLFAIGFLAFISIRKEKDVRKIFFLFFASSILPLGVALYQWFAGIGMADTSLDVPRIFGTFAHPNVLALYLYSLLVVACLFFHLEDQKRPTVWLFFYVGLVMVLLLLTFTRVAWIAAFLFLLALALWRYRRLLAPLVLGPLLLILLVPSIQERVTESFETNPDSSVVWREGIWHDVTAKLAIDEKRLWGTGLDTFTQYAEDLRGIQFGSTDAHNDFIKFYVEGGVVGLLIFFAYVFLLAKKGVGLLSLSDKHRDLAVIFLIYGATLFLSSLTDNVYKDTPIQWIFFILFGALLGLKRLKTTEGQ